MTSRRIRRALRAPGLLFPDPRPPLAGPSRRNFIPGLAPGLLLGGAGGGATDPHWANVVLLSGFEGADGSTTFTDESNSGHTMTAAGNAQIDTAQFKFGSSSALFDGTTDAITMAQSDDWHWSTLDFTVEGWFRFANNTSTMCLLSRWNSDGSNNRVWALYYINTNVLRFDVSSNGSSSTILVTTSTFTPTVGQWYHIAVDRFGNDFRIYVDGVMLGKATNTISLFSTGITSQRIGAINNSNQLSVNGHIDEVRQTKGVARYASDGGFTAPTAAFPRS